ncbi:hypothetical protein KAI87_07760 [Myxococcota bacterium]|nr:hypothetical protein [Myxococcota bacterium]
MNKKIQNKKPKAETRAGQVAHQTSLLKEGSQIALSEIIKEMATSVLKDPNTDTASDATVKAVLMLASAAWNSANGDDTIHKQHRKLGAKLEWDGAPPYSELRSKNTDQLITELAMFKKKHYPRDRRNIMATEMTPEGNLRVHWADPTELSNAKPSNKNTHKNTSKKVKAILPGAQRGTPIANKIAKKLNRYIRAKVVDFTAVSAGKKAAEELQQTIATQEELASLHPAYAIYAYAQNQVSVLEEELSALKEMHPFNKLISEADEVYMPGGPPMSPLTKSYFAMWASFDACVGPSEETVGTTILKMGSAIGMNEELLRVIELMQQSRMGIWVHEGIEKDTVVLREFVTGRVCKALSPSGYMGRKGELWYVRVLPPPASIFTEHVIFGTPYVLREPGEHGWGEYFARTLPTVSIESLIATYEHHMKFGPTRDYWSEFVFEAYFNHRPDAIFLSGLPDIPESLPHSSVNS